MHLEIATDRIPAGIAPKLDLANPRSASAGVAALGKHWPRRLDTDAADERALCKAARSSTDATVKRAATAMALAMESEDVRSLLAADRELARASTPRSLRDDVRSTGSADELGLPRVQPKRCR